MKSLSPAELKAWMDDNTPFMLIDVREDWEREVYNIGGEHIPLGDVMARRDEIPVDKPVVVYCEKGIRSSIIIQRLEGIGFNNLYNLSGGYEQLEESESELKSSFYRISASVLPSLVTDSLCCIPSVSVKLTS